MLLVLLAVEILLNIVFTLGYDVSFIREMRKTKQSAAAVGLMSAVLQIIAVTVIGFFHFGSDYLKPDCSIEAFGERIHKTLKRYPYLVSEKDGRLAGYAYAGPFKERRAYDWSVETTIYIAKDVEDMGLGKNFTPHWSMPLRFRM